MNNDRTVQLPLPPPGQAHSSGTSSPRLSSLSSVASHTGSQSSYTSVSSLGPKTPSPSLPSNVITGPPTAIATYDAMNQPQPDMYYPQQHLSQAPPPQQTAPMSHYPAQQAPVMQPGHTQYPNPAPPYNQYGYPAANGGLTSPPSAQPAWTGPMATPQNVLPLPQGNAPGQFNNGGNQSFDTSGQNPPPGMKPRVTATLWEDEGSLCFQVEARGICVARREDNHMINGTKLLNVAGMTRGRRDGILKSEKVRHVVKIGPMHLKGVWIPYDRALEFANKEKITEMLYPLFVHNIGALLYHPTNQSRTSQVMAAAERRKAQENSAQMRPNNPGSAGLPSLPQQAHQPVGVAGPQPSLPSQGNGMGRPSLDRNQESFNNWQGQGMNGAPASTPPGPSVQQMSQYPTVTQGYDNSRQMYTTQQSPYQNTPNHPQDRMYAQAAYPKNEMGPPSGRTSVSGPVGEQQNRKAPNGLHQPDQPSQSHPTGEEDQDHEQEAEYTHDSGVYDANRAPYNYTAPGVGHLANEANMSPDMTASPNHHPVSGRATPRTATAHQPYYQQHPGYNTPPRVSQTSSNLYNVVSNDRGPSNGGPNDVYAPQADMSNGLPNGYAPNPPGLNGSMGMKRGRDDEDDSRPPSDGSAVLGPMDLKRRKTMIETSVPAPTYDSMSRPASATTVNRRR